MTFNELCFSKQNFFKDISVKASKEILKGNTPVYQKHVRPGNYTMLSNDTLVITPQGRLMDENGRTTKILKTDIAASNGVIHVIDRVLLPK